MRGMILVTIGFLVLAALLLTNASIRDPADEAAACCKYTRRLRRRHSVDKFKRIWRLVEFTVFNASNLDRLRTLN